MFPDSVIQIESALESIRDYLRSDGGDVRVVEILEEEGIVRVELLGNCESCSMSQMTLKGGIEETIRRAAPWVKRVEAV